jgi:hypothetical protein
MDFQSNETEFVWCLHSCWDMATFILKKKKKKVQHCETQVYVMNTNTSSQLTMKQEDWVEPRERKKLANP